MRRIGVAALVVVLFSIPAFAKPLRIKVVDPQGAAIAGAAVTVGRQGARTTDAEGGIVSEAGAPVIIRVEAPGFAVKTVRLDDWTQDAVVIELLPEPVYSTVNIVVRREELGAGPAVASAVQIGQTGARTVFDAVDRLMPGALVTRRGVMGYGIAQNGTGIVAIRGVGGTPNTGILVVIDGRPDYMGLMGHPLPDFYSLADTASVSVTQGPASVLYGTNAMGGAIEIRPHTPAEGFETELSTGLGTYWTGQHRLKHGLGARRWFYNLTAGVDHTNGHRPSAHFRNQDGTFAIGRNLSEAWTTSLRGRYGHFVVEDPGPVGQPPGNWAGVGRGGFTWALDNAWDRLWGDVRLFGSWGHHHISDGWRSNDRTLGGRVHQNVPVTPTLLVDFGADLADFGGEGRNVTQRREYGRHFATSAAGFGRLHWSPRARVRFHTGLRREHSSIFGGITAPEWGASLGFAEAWSLSVSVARGFRNPTIRELYLFPAPNPGLRPEHMWNYQATLTVQSGREVAASVTAYYAAVDNVVVLTGRFPNLKLSNAGRALNRGVEANLRWRIAPRIAVRSGYAYLRSTNLPPYVPRHKATYAVEFDFGRAFLHLGGMSVGSRWADARRVTELDRYTVPVVKLTAPLGRRWTLFAMVDNFTDARYEVITGYPMPGINATGGLTVRF